MPKIVDPLLSINNLSVAFKRFGELNEVVSNVSFSIKQGEKLALVGESGSGKSVTAQSIMQLYDAKTVNYSGDIFFENENLFEKTEKELMTLRGNDIAMIFQEPMTALNPLKTVGSQIIENILVHQNMAKQDANKRALELIKVVGIDHAEKRINSFPHMLSGGQRQRIMIAMALSCSPKLLIADEPTTALDVTVKLQIIELLEKLQKEFNMAILIITHDLNLVKRFADNVMVMNKGQIVEKNTTTALFAKPKDAYTQKLLNSMPVRLVNNNKNSKTLLSANNIKKQYCIKKAWLKNNRQYLDAVDDISLSIQQGKTLGIVGESGSGKSTLGRCILQLESSQGEVIYLGKTLSALKEKAMRPYRKELQIVFQDPFSSLSPRMTVNQILQEGLAVHFPHLSKQDKEQKVNQVLKDVELEEHFKHRYPHEFSGGQRQRIAIARSIIIKPKLILLDEPTSALDVSIQQQILNLLVQLQNKYQLSYIIISHDLAVINALSHHVMVMQHGKVVEQNETDALFKNPQKKYTQTLISASGM